jgi:hypothetical protein
MPDDRFIHPRLRMSQKVSALSDLEFRVWVDYILAANDYGVMSDNPAVLRGGNTALAVHPELDLRNALDNIVATGLLVRFEHQGQSFLCDPVWQDYQKVTFPRGTFLPAPKTDEIMSRLSRKTARLFKERHPQWSDTSNLEPESTHEERSSSSRGRVGHRLKANGKRLEANGKRQTANGKRERKPREPRPHYVRELLTAYENAFRGRYQRKPMITSRDAKTAKEVLNSFDTDNAKALPEAIELVNAYLASNDPFVLQVGHDFSTLPSQANRLITAGVNRKAPSRNNLSEKFHGVTGGEVKL